MSASVSPKNSLPRDSPKRSGENTATEAPAYIERVNRGASSREMFAANAWSASRVENMQTVDITKKRHGRGAFVERIVRLCRNGCCVALCKLGIRFTSDGLPRFIHVCHALASASKGELYC
jgi:hypothetical protein